MIYQGDIGIHDIKIGDVDVFEIYQGTKLVYPDNNTVTITFNLNVSGTVTINGYTPVISENNTKFIFTLPVKTDYTATIEAEHYQPKTINENSGYLPTTHDVKLQWKIKHDVYTITFPDNGVKVLFDGVEKGVIASHGLVVLVDDRYSKDSYVVTFEGGKDSIYDVDELTVDNIDVPSTGGTYDLTSSTSPVKTNYKRKDYASSTGSVSKGSTYNGYWVETVVNLTASFTVQTTLGSITNKVLTIGNNESTTAKSGILTVNYTLESGTRTVTANVSQAAGAKVYTDWVLDLQTDGTTVNASGGTRTVTANIARRTYKWNNTGTVYSETENGNPTLSKSGDGILSGTSSGSKLTYTNNTSTSTRSTRVTATYNSVSKYIDISQYEGAKQLVNDLKYHCVYYGSSMTGTGQDNTTYPHTDMIGVAFSANGEERQVYYKLYSTQTWNWNGIDGSGGVETKKYTIGDIVIMEEFNCGVAFFNDKNDFIECSIRASKNTTGSSRSFYAKWRNLRGPSSNVITTMGSQSAGS